MSRKRSVAEMSLPDEFMTGADRELYQQAWETARKHHGIDFTFYLPGMIRLGRERGRYPALSITGEKCQLLCEHCKGELLHPMIEVTQEHDLVAKCRKLFQLHNYGVLLSGGADPKGRLPWRRFYHAIKTIKTETGLLITAHVGFPDLETCLNLSEAGVDQALIDVVGDDETARAVYHLESREEVTDALENIAKSGLQCVPHIVAGLNYGKIKGENEAIDIIGNYNPAALVIVVLTPLKGTPMACETPPSPIEVGRLIAKARLSLPDVPISLGCERPRNQDGREMEKLAILAGANRMAIWSEETLKEVKKMGLKPRFQPTCCSLGLIPGCYSDMPTPGFTEPAGSR